ncbi:MAG: hypothetical protein ABSE85_07780 [Candidatus Korobacteraceae bacterium]
MRGKSLSIGLRAALAIFAVTLTTCEGGAYENGTAFGLTPTAGGGWMEQVLFSFGHGYGACPVAGLIFDAAGNLYGAATGRCDKSLPHK